ncbi:cation-translocating P-type ATPase [bacterium]|nr:cation-translocating P-type ATPase [bacterium]
MSLEHFNITGLTHNEVLSAREKYGQNLLEGKIENALLDLLKDLFKEPMVVILFIASIIYFIGGNMADGLFLIAAIILISAISIYQDAKSRNAIEKLKTYSQAKCKVIRESKVENIKSSEVVVGDSLIMEEGSTIVADGIIVHSNDFSVNESILTGESFSVQKDKSTKDNTTYNGTTVVSGLAIATVTAVGNNTQLGKIGKSLEDIQQEKTPLEIQINNFVKKMAIAGIIVFLIVWAINYYNSSDVLDSLLKALTLAMSILPEEIPVAFTTFMALGSWRLMKLGVIVKQIKTVETLGSATIICTDKTGTITENRMSLARLFVLSNNKISNAQGELNLNEKALIRNAMWASEPIPFDPMEIALHLSYKNTSTTDERPEYEMVHEYPLGGKPPMMTHIFEDKAGHKIIAAKGAPEALIAVSNLSDKEKQQIHDAISSITIEGFRVLAVGRAVFEGSDYPKKQQDFKFKLSGIVGFYDPPKKNIQKVLTDLYNAGIKVKIITGDNAATTAAIAKEIKFKGYEKSISGDELMTLQNNELQKTVNETYVFTRMFPEAKLKIINALKSNNEIVAMIGDGVNDSPALKAAHIGVGMGKKGTEIAKQAASLVLLEDDLSSMVDAIAMGRRIYANLKKAIQYIISIHIPIILTVFIPLALGWKYPNIFSPVHVIFLELIMGPTCSIIYENEPMEKNTMVQKPRPFTATFFKYNELFTSIIQGLLITTGVLISYIYTVNNGYNEPLTRTMVFTTLIAANVMLTLVNRSFYYSILTTIKYKNNLVLLIISTTIALMAILLYVSPLTTFFKFESLNFNQLSICIGFGFISVIWYEGVKWINRIKKT